MKIKSFILPLLSLIFAMVLSACNNRLSENQISEIIQFQIDQMDIPETLEQSISLPLEIQFEEHLITVLWESSNSSYLSNTGVVTRPSFEVGDQTVILTAYFSYQGVTLNQQFEVLILKMDEIVQETWTITFDSMGGSTILPISSIVSGSTIVLPTPPVKSGYDFIEWHTNIELTAPFNPTSPIESNLTLYAKWQMMITYTVSFDTLGGSIVLPITGIIPGSSIQMPSDPIKEGFEFIGWYLDSQYKNAYLNDPVTSNLTLYAKWQSVIITYTVTFVTFGGNDILPLTDVVKDTLWSLPDQPVKDGFEFAGWFLDESLTIPYQVLPITANLVLYVKWIPIEIIPEGTPISTALEFNQLSNSGAPGVYYLANDIDFTGYSWQYVNFNFTGTLNGNGKTLSNLNLQGTDRTGLFSRVKVATIYNLTLDNINVTSTNRAGILVGEADGDQVNLSDICIFNSSVSGNSSNGVGGLIGYSKSGFRLSISRILIENTTVNNTSSAAGGLIGMTDGSLVTIEDIQFKDVSINASNRAGGIYGEIKGTATVSIQRVVIDVLVSTAQYLGGIVGRNQTVSGISVSHVLITGELISTNKDAGHISGDLPITTVSNIFIAGLTLTGTFNKQNVNETQIIQSIDLINLDWWSDNLAEISDSKLWYYESPMFRLVVSNYVPTGSHPVTIILTNEQEPQVIYVKSGQTLNQLQTPTLTGFIFQGWYLDISFSVEFTPELIINEPITIYAKWTQLPKHSVIIDGVSQFVFEGDQVTQPSDPYRLGHIFIGWYLGDVPYDFNQPVEESLVISARFEDAELFVLTLNTMQSEPTITLSFYENQQVSVLPSPVKTGYRFIGWYVDQSLTIVFNMEYLTSNLTIYAKYVESIGMILDEPFDYLIGTHLGETVWNPSKLGTAVITETNVLQLTETENEAIYDRAIGTLPDGRYILYFEFKQGTGGAAFTVELTNGTTRVFTVGANRTNRFTYRNSDGTEMAIPTTTTSVVPNQYLQVFVVFDTEFDTYKYFVRQQGVLIELTPQGGVSFASPLDIQTIRIRIVGHKNVPSENPNTWIKQLLIDSSSLEIGHQSIYDPEEGIDFQVLIDQVYGLLDIPFMDNIRGNIRLASSINQVLISWTTSNPSVIDILGNVTRHETLDQTVTLTATLTKGIVTLEKVFLVTVKSLANVEIFNDADYHLSGFALGNITIPNLNEGDPGYYVVTNPREFMLAINAENSASQGTTAARIIEIRNDLNMGYLEVQREYGTFSNLTSHATPKMHPILKETGIGKIVIQERDGNNSKYHEGLVIFSKSGHTIRHAAFSIKRSNNIVIRNLKFDELWEWDEATKGDYDSNDWDYFTIDTVDGIWFDHIELGKAYDGLIDFKAGSSISQTVRNATFSYMKLNFVPNAFIQAQFDYLETNRQSFNYYNTMRNAGMTMEEIMVLNSFQKKGFLLGGSSLRAGNVFTLTIHNSYIKNLQDRLPRLRGGDVHIFNVVYDADDVYQMRSEVRAKYTELFLRPEYNRQLTNQAIITTENGAILVETSIFKGVSQVIKSNQVGSDHPIMTGKYQVLSSMYILDDYVFYGSSEDPETPFVRANSEPILPFSWTTITGLPYQVYRLIQVNVLEEYLNSGILGTTSQPFNWLSVQGQPTVS